VSLTGDDGGIFKRTNPTNSTGGKWLSLNGNIRIAECHSGDYDFASGLAICGAQDQGTSVGYAGSVFYKIGSNDGGVVATSQQTTPHKFYRTSQYMGLQPGCAIKGAGQPLRTVNITLPFPFTSQVESRSKKKRKKKENFDNMTITKYLFTNSIQ